MDQLFYFLKGIFSIRLFLVCAGYLSGGNLPSFRSRSVRSIVCVIIIVLAILIRVHNDWLLTFALLLTTLESTRDRSGGTGTHPKIPRRWRYSVKPETKGPAHEE